MQTIKLNKQEDKVVKWVLQARSKDKSRPVLTGVFIEHLNDIPVMVCCDGFKAFAAELEGEYEDGLYTVLTHSNKILVLEPLSGMFPNYKAILKDGIKDGQVIDTDNNNLTNIDPKMLKAAASMPSDDIQIAAGGWNKPMAFSGGSGLKMYGMIMPRHLKD